MRQMNHRVGAQEIPDFARRHLNFVRYILDRLVLLDERPDVFRLLRPRPPLDDIARVPGDDQPSCGGPRRCQNDLSPLDRLRGDVVAQAPELADQFVGCQVRAVKQLQRGEPPVALNDNLLAILLDRDQRLARVEAAEFYDGLGQLIHVFVRDQVGRNVSLGGGVYERGYARVERVQL